MYEFFIGSQRSSLGVIPREGGRGLMGLSMWRKNGVFGIGLDDTRAKPVIFTPLRRSCPKEGLSEG